MRDAVDSPSHGKLVGSGIRVQYEGIRAVDGVDLTLEQGQIMGLVGQNGAGKTTLMNALSGFAPLAEGTVKIDSLDVTGWPPHRLVRQGLVRTFQDIATFPELTVFENVELGSLGSGLGRRDARKRALHLLDSMDLAHLSRLPASALPHGDERRVGIARAAASQPRFLLLDEPAAGLDDTESLELVETIASLRQTLSCGVLLVEHDMRIIMSVCELIHVVDHGRTITVGTSAEIATNKAVIAAYLGEKGAPSATSQ